MRNTFKIFFLLLLSIESPAQIYNIVKVMQTDIDEGRGMHTNNNYVFVADGSSGIKIFQTSTNSFNLITSFDTDGSANSVFVSSDFLFVADGSKGIKVYFIQNIAAPVLMDSEQVGNATFVTLKGNYLYAIVDYDFLIFDISNPAALNLLSRVNTTGNSTPFTILINGSAAYLSENGSDGGMEVYNISNPNSPALSTKFTYTGICYDAVIHQGTLHVTQGYFMHHYDIQNPLLPVETSKDSLGGKPSQMTTRHDIMVYLDGRKIRCYPPETSSVYEHGGYVSYLYASNEFLRTTDYFYTAGDSLTAFDIVITEVEEDKNNPTKFLLSQNYPNPFNPSTKIRITILAGVETRRGVSLRVFDILVREVATLVNEEKPAGEYEVEFPNNIVRQAAS